MNKINASDFCFVCCDGDDVYAIINSIEAFQRDGHVDDTGDHDAEIERIIPDFDQLTDSTWECQSYDTVEGLRQFLLSCGFVELTEFTEFMKRHQ